MADEHEHMEIEPSPGLLRLAEDVREPEERVMSRVDDDGRPTRDFAGLVAAAGSWQDEDTDAILAEIDADRQRSIRPPVA